MYWGWWSVKSGGGGGTDWEGYGKGQKGRKEYLSASSGVLRGTAGDELGVVVLEKVFVEGHVFLLGENSVIGLDVVLLE